MGGVAVSNGAFSHRSGNSPWGDVLGVMSTHAVEQCRQKLSELCMSGRTDRTPFVLASSGRVCGGGGDGGGGLTGLCEGCVWITCWQLWVHGQLAAFLMLPSCCSSAGLDECCAYAVQYSSQRAFKVLEDDTNGVACALQVCLLDTPLSLVVIPPPLTLPTPLPMLAQALHGLWAITQHIFSLPRTLYHLSPPLSHTPPRGGMCVCVSRSLVPALMDELRAAGMLHVLVVVGGIIPPQVRGQQP